MLKFGGPGFLKRTDSYIFVSVDKFLKFWEIAVDGSQVLTDQNVCPNGLMRK